MYVITAREVIRGVRDRWNEQYPKDEFKFWDGSLAGDKRARLNALNLETCSREDVEAALGSDWAENECTVCKKHKDSVVHIGDELAYEARYVRVCDDCLAEARAAIMITEPVNT